MKQGYDVIRGVPGKCRFAEMPVSGNIVIRRDMKVGEIAPSAAGNAYLTAYVGRMVNDGAQICPVYRPRLHNEPDAPAPMMIASCASTLSGYIRGHGRIKPRVKEDVGHELHSCVQ